VLAPSGHRNDHRARLDVEGWIWESRTGSAVIAVDVNAGTLAAPTLTTWMPDIRGPSSSDARPFITRTRGLRDVTEQLPNVTILQY
jgi:hypothetical protein